MLPDLAFPDLRHAQRIERVLLWPADRDAGHPTAIGSRDDDLRRPIVGGDLNSAPGGNELPAFVLVAQRFGTGVVIPVFDVQMEKAFFVAQRAVGLDLVTVRPLRVPLGDRQQPLIGAIRHPGRKFDSPIDLDFLAVFDQPNAA